jgi:predicted dehydrogenase/threonine dehydrogenase-like Zn-dependent dehydrogenase
MKQVLQSMRSGEVTVLSVPPPQVRPNGLLVRTGASLISPGTERTLLDFAQKGLIGKARGRPELVRQVLDKVKRDGFLEAARVTLGRLERPMPGGYACAGTVIAVGPEVRDVEVGDRVACAGAGYANHAEVNYIPRNLAVPIPRRRNDGVVPFEEASFATLGAIALHGVRLGQPAIRDRVVVIGLGLVGLLTTQILRAQGCAVLGVDPNPLRRELARSLGVDDACLPEGAAERTRAFTRGLGADVVIIAAAARDSRPVELAAAVARDRARVVAVGATGLDLPRRSYYAKELSLVVSRSYGPGRYDRSFEEEGRDYPVGYVRWTERENMRAFLELLAEGRLNVAGLITHRVPIEEAARAYEFLSEPGALAVVIDYPPPESSGASPGVATTMVQLQSVPLPAAARVGVSVLGAGAFAQDMLLPLLKRLPDVELRGVVSGGGLSARVAGDRFGFAFCASDADAIWADERTRAVVIATRNDQHAALVGQAMAAGKAVFVEKPLCLSGEELSHLVSVHDKVRGLGWSLPVSVGFNRRFAPLAQVVHAFFRDVDQPLTVHYRINAGRLPEGSWVDDPIQGGGRILSEVCHFVDLAAFLVSSPIASVYAQGVGTRADDVVVVLRHRNDSVSTIGYYTGGDRSASKERVEVFGGGAMAVIDDFRQALIVHRGRRRRLGTRLGSPRKGHREELAAFVQAVRAGNSGVVPFGEAVATTYASLAIRESLAQGVRVDVAHTP